MKSESTFNRESTISFWIKQTCFTIDYEGADGFLEDLTYMSSFLICQMRENFYSTPPDREITILFMLRNVEKVNECIESLMPPDSLDQEAIALPETREFIVLNGTELDSPYTYNKLNGFAFLPSGMIDILPKKTKFNPPSIAHLWPEVWEMIKVNTSETARRIFCSSFATFGVECRDDELNLKQLLKIQSLNKIAIINLMDSKNTVPCRDEEDKEKWRLKPGPDLTERNDDWKLDNHEFKHILPGNCSYSFIWKGERTLCKRNYHIREESIAQLTESEKARDIDEAPKGMMEKIPRRLSFNEKSAVDDILFRRYRNINFSNPKYLATFISDGRLLRIWKTAFDAYKNKITKLLTRRGKRMHDTIEFISLLEHTNRHSNIKSNEWPGINRINEAATDHEFEIRHNCFRSILEKNL
jgi:hypothetical protein